YAQTEEHTKAAHWLEQAGDRATAGYATAAALGHYTTAREHLAMGGAPPVAVAGLDEKVGGVLLTLGRYAAAVAVLERAVETYQRAGDQDGRWRVLAHIGEAYIGAGTPEQGLARLHPLLEVVETSAPTPGLAALCAALANLFSTTYQHDNHLAAAARA